MPRWTPEEDTHLTELYLTGVPVAEIAQELGRTRGTVKRRASELGLLRGKTHAWSAADDARLAGLYVQEHLPVDEIAQTFGVGVAAVKHRVRSLGLHRERRLAETTFFKTWTPASAYVLGYWFADGNMYYQAATQSWTVSIASQDVAHLEQLRELIGTGTLTRITHSEVFKLVICSKEMYTDLLRLGGSERKSLTLTWPDGVIPDTLLAHFVRGYVDGDGCLRWNKTAPPYPEINATGARPFLTGMAQAIERATGIVTQNYYRVGVEERIWKVVWYGVSAKCLTIWLYHGCEELFLLRKGEMALAFLDWQPQRSSTQPVTPRMWELFGAYL
jgi:transposase-like protein